MTARGSRVGFSRREALVGGSAALAAAAIHYPAAAAAAAPLSFLVIGDWGRDGREYQRHVARQMGLEAARTRARFVVTTGDNFYELGVSDARDRRWKTSFDNVYTDAALQVSWFPVLGNHDYGGNVLAQVERTEICSRWRMPSRWYKIEGSTFGAPQLDLFFIDTLVWQGKESFPFNLFGDGVGGSDQALQERWLRQELLASKAKLKLVFGHFPIFSIGKHGGSRRMADLDALLRQAGVTGYVHGHDHCLYHIESGLMDYVCSGGGSEELKAFTGDPLQHGCVIPARCDGETGLPRGLRWTSFVDRAGFAAFDVHPDRVEFRLIDRSGVVFKTDSLPARMPDPAAT